MHVLSLNLTSDEIEILVRAASSGTLTEISRSMDQLLDRRLGGYRSFKPKHELRYELMVGAVLSLLDTSSTRVIVKGLMWSDECTAACSLHAGGDYGVSLYWIPRSSRVNDGGELSTSCL